MKLGELTTFTDTVMDRLVKYARAAGMELRAIEKDLVISNREIVITVKDYEKATMYEGTYREGTKFVYYIFWNDGALDIHEGYCCYNTPSFMGIWDRNN